MIGQRTFQFNATAIQLTNFRFRVGFKRHRQMAADKAAKRLVQTLGFLDVKGERCKTFRQPFTLGMQGFDTAFARGTTKNRHRREAGITPLTLGGFYYYRFFQLINAENAVIKRLRIPFDEIEIFRTIRQSFKLFGDQRQIRHHDSMTRRTVQRREVRRIFKANIVIDFRQQNAAEAFRQRVQTLIFRPARLT